MAPKKPHIVCIPCPPQGHINPMMKLAKLLHSRGFYITLVLSEFDFARLTSSSALEFSSLQSLDDFRVETFPDGLPMDDKRGVRELPKLALSFVRDEAKQAFRGVLLRLLASRDVPTISYIVSDHVVVFPTSVGKELGIPVWVLFTTSACGLLATYMQLDELVKRGLFPLKDESYLTNGYLEAPLDWIPGLIKGAKMKHLPPYTRSTNQNDTMFNYLAETTRNALVADGTILNTFDDLEEEVLETIKAKIPKLYTVGPLTLLCRQLNNGQELLPHKLSLWKEDTNCLEWLNTRSPKSVIYVSFGSLAILTHSQAKEFAWGLANSNHSFLWVIRSDLIEGVSSIITDEYMEEIEGRGLISSWCPQDKVLQHTSIAVFITHCGWNSMLDSIIEGVPMICWPFFADQHIISLYACQEWRIGVEMGESEVSREKIEKLVKEIMEGEMGKKIKSIAMDWKKKAEDSTNYGGSSNSNFNELVKCLMEKEVHIQHM